MFHCSIKLVSKINLQKCITAATATNSLIFRQFHHNPSIASAALEGLTELNDEMNGLFGFDSLLTHSDPFGNDIEKKRSNNSKHIVVDTDQTLHTGLHEINKELKSLFGDDFEVDTEIGSESESEGVLNNHDDFYQQYNRHDIKPGMESISHNDNKLPTQDIDPQGREENDYHFAFYDNIPSDVHAIMKKNCNSTPIPGLNSMHTNSSEKGVDSINISPVDIQNNISIANSTPTALILTLGDYSDISEHIRAINSKNQQVNGQHIRLEYVANIYMSNPGRISETSLKYVQYCAHLQTQADKQCCGIIIIGPEASCRWSVLVSPNILYVLQLQSQSIPIIYCQYENDEEVLAVDKNAKNDAFEFSYSSITGLSLKQSVDLALSTIGMGIFSGTGNKTHFTVEVKQK